jgi:hypothetical protein
LTACSPGAQTENLRELRRVRSGSLDVVLLSANDALRQGKSTFIVEFRSAADGQVIDVGDVRGSATMPMAGMPPMSGTVEVRRTATAGRYSVTTDLSMAGDWRIGVEWDGSAGRGSAMLSTSAR